MPRIATRGSDLNGGKSEITNHAPTTSFGFLAGEAFSMSQLSVRRARQRTQQQQNNKAIGHPWRMAALPSNI
jgi:hypothetical protein